MYDCVICGTEVNTNRARLGFNTCLTCGEVAARRVRHTVVPLAKSNYIAVTDPKMLKQLNKYAN